MRMDLSGSTAPLKLSIFPQIEISCMNKSRACSLKSYQIISAESLNPLLYSRSLLENCSKPMTMDCGMGLLNQFSKCFENELFSSNVQAALIYYFLTFPQYNQPHHQQYDETLAL